MVVEAVEIVAYVVMIGYYGGHMITAHVIRKKLQKKRAKQKPKLIKVVH